MATTTIHTVLLFAFPADTPKNRQRIAFNQPTWNGRMSRSTDPGFQAIVDRYKRHGNIVILADLVEDDGARRYTNERTA